MTAVVFDDEERVLLVRRADNGRWALVTGCLEPGEQPALGTVREVFEETGVVAAVERLISVEALPPDVCPNGDQVQWLDLAFQCRAVSGAARVNDDESIEVGWFRLDALPALHDHMTRCIADAVGGDVGPRFVVPGSPPLGDNNLAAHLTGRAERH